MDDWEDWEDLDDAALDSKVEAAKMGFAQAPVTKVPTTPSTAASTPCMTVTAPKMDLEDNGLPPAFESEDDVEISQDDELPEEFHQGSIQFGSEPFPHRAKKAGAALKGFVHCFGKYGSVDDDTDQARWDIPELYPGMKTPECSFFVGDSVLPPGIVEGFQVEVLEVAGGFAFDLLLGLTSAPPKDEDPLATCWDSQSILFGRAHDQIGYINGCVSTSFVPLAKTRYARVGDRFGVWRDRTGALLATKNNKVIGVLIAGGAIDRDSVPVLKLLGRVRRVSLVAPQVPVTSRVCDIEEWPIIPLPPGFSEQHVKKNDVDTLRLSKTQLRQMAEGWSPLFC